MQDWEMNIALEKWCDKALEEEDNVKRANQGNQEEEKQNSK